MNKTETEKNDHSSLQEIGTLSKVTNLRQRFESFKCETQEKVVRIKPKPPTPPKKSYLMRSATMRDSLLIDNRKGLQANSFQQDFCNIRLNDDSSEDEFYDNVPISPLSCENPK